ncbi:dihydroorotase, homodimeric type [Allomyces macrogynus ATCC 38327]|uniref:dihydroorotase n=1 Tax=Allomyces macrogynus (strain ATCC 38327) TaxID=578462 RepID=A0A0L0SEF0_ALLM3|nr:dihydroorotase, homodimeric type [Allomyces macrogynus ATCC 38327]|eukprot:KNE60822.1 dihydroorotase, homodimeric type [Allomyces macrogynus ATCC 38327]
MAPVPTGTKITLPAAADMHIHLRQGPMCDAVTKALVGTGVDTVYVMPNLVPPLTTVDMAVAYRDQLRALAPSINFLVTLYLSPELTPDEIRKAKKHGIAGVKSYPRGVTTNSDSGIEDYDVYYPVFKAMEEEGLVLNLHGECPSNAEANITILNAEAKFLSHLEKLHRAFPKLRIVLEHATTKAAVDLVQRLGNTVACTITVHHLFLTVEDWAVTLTKVDVAAAKGDAGTKVPAVFAVPRMLKDNGENVEVVPFLAGETIPWTLQVADK